MREKHTTIEKIVIFILLTSTQLLYAQFNNSDDYHLDYSYKNYGANYTTPTVASLGQYVNFPVSLYTGVPDISVPIYTIEQHGYSLPIYMSYHSRGLQVEQVATWTGLGWNLKGVSLIGRTVNGAPDDIRKAWDEDETHTSVGYLLHNNLQMPSDVYYEEDNPYSVEEVENLVGDYEDIFGTPGYSYVYDTEPDVFFYEIPGYTGKFVLQNNAGIIQAHQLEQSDVQIEVLWDAQKEEEGCIRGFVLTSPDGVKHFFNEQQTNDYVELSQSITIVADVGTAESRIGNPLLFGVLGEGAYNFPSTALNYNYGFEHISAWHVNRIELLNKSNIYFDYSNYSTHNHMMEREQYSGHKIHHVENGPFTPAYLKTATGIKVHGRQIHRIRFEQGQLDFTADLLREDVVYRLQMGNDADYVYKNQFALTDIALKDREGVFLKRLKLEYDYFESELDDNYVDLLLDTEYFEDMYYNNQVDQADRDNFLGRYGFLLKRLKLKSIQEYRTDFTTAEGYSYLPAYQFSYYEENAMPPRYSRKQDLWGYYKGMVEEEVEIETLLPVIYHLDEQTQEEYKVEFSAFHIGTPQESISIFPGIESTVPLFDDDLTLQSNRTYPMLEYCRTGVLKSVQHPTGGSTTYHYELNNFELGNETR